MMCLLRATELFEAGLGEIHHGQVVSYYKCLLDFLDGESACKRGHLPLVLADKPAAYYRLWLNWDGAPNCFCYGFDVVL